MRIAHLALLVQDMDASLKFYCDGLGFTHAFSLPHPATGERWLEYVRMDEGQFLELMCARDGQQRGGFHFCLEVEDFEGFCKAVSARGIEIIPANDNGSFFNIQAYIVDPDGNRIELTRAHTKSPLYGNW